MLTEEEKLQAERRALDQVHQEIHEAEIKEYEQRVAEDAREKFRIDDAKTNMLYQVNRIIWVCCGVAAVGGFMLFKRFALDLTYDSVTLWLWVVGIAIGYPIGFAWNLIMERIDEAPRARHGHSDEGKMRNEKSGVRRLLLFSLLGSILFIGLPRGYVHCPYDVALESKNMSRAEHQQLVGKWAKDVRVSMPPELCGYCLEEKDNKKILLYMFWIAFGASAIGLVLSGRLRNSFKV